MVIKPLIFLKILRFKESKSGFALDLVSHQYAFHPSPNVGRSSMLELHIIQKKYVALFISHEYSVFRIDLSEFMPFVLTQFLSVAPVRSAGSFSWSQYIELLHELVIEV